MKRTAKTSPMAKKLIRKSKKTTGDKLRNQLKKAGKTKKVRNDFLWAPSGSTLFNQACSDHCKGAYKTGTMVNVVGDSSSGKSILVLTGMAATAQLPEFDNFRLIYDDAEFADSFDHAKLFGKKFTARLEAPSKNGPSTTIEQFYDNVMDACDDGRPFIYCLDSFDAIDADAEIEKELKNREYRKAGTLSKIKGSFQATKQKKASMLFRQICSKLKKTNSLLIIISQTRDNLNAMSFSTKYRAGGRALKFYASIEAWLTYIGPLTKTVHSVKYDIGVDTRAKIEKNKYTGKKKSVDFPIYTDLGIDDITSCIDYLIKTKHWKMKKSTIIAREFNVKMTKAKLISHIEKDLKKRVLVLSSVVEYQWLQIEESLKLNRKSRFE